MDVDERTPVAYNVNSFRWSEEEFTLRMVVEMFRHQLPFLMVITEGYLGTEDWICELPLYEMHWLYGFTTQTRIVVKDKKGVYYGIPDSYRELVIPITDTGVEESPMTVTELLKCNKYRFLKFSETRMVVKRIGQVQIIDTYEERFLVTHLLQEGTLLAKFMLVPCSVSVKIAVALTTTRGGQRTFFKAMKEFRDLAEGYPHDYSYNLKQFSEVTVFSGKPHTGDYEYITSLPLQIASNVQSSSVSEERGFLKGSTQSRRMAASKAIPVAHGMCAEDRLRQLKLFFLGKQLPGDDVEEGTMPSNSEQVQGQNKPKSGGLRGFFAKKKKTHEFNSRCQTTNAKPNKEQVEQRMDEVTKEMECMYVNVSTEPLVTPVNVTGNILYANAAGHQPSYYQVLQTKPSVINETDTSRRPYGKVVPEQQPSQDVSIAMPDQQRPLQRLADIPLDLSSLSVSDVCQCLELLGLSRHKQKMREHLVDGTMLLCLTESILLEQFEFSAFEAKQLAMFVGGYRPKL